MLGLRQVVRQRVLVPSFAGSNPAGPATMKQKKTRRVYFFVSSFAVGDAGFEPGSIV